jgi:regulator of protease activity HflC (stomatin/prohibitin superfamily)
LLDKILKNPIVAGMTMGGTLLALGMVASNTHIIKDTEVGVLITNGKIDLTPVTTGFKVTLPFFQELRKVDITEEVAEYNNMALPTIDEASQPAIANMAITYRLNGSMVPSLIADFGTIDNFINSRLRQPVFSEARNFSSEVKNTRLLQRSRSTMGTHMHTYLDSRHAGYDIVEVMVQTIEAHTDIAERIAAAAARIELNVVEAANVKIAATRAEVVEATARGQEQVRNAEARGRAYEVTAQADARAHAILAEAEAQRDGMKAIAEGNKALDESLTPAILEDKRIAVQATFASKSKGLMPHTILNGDISTLGVPVTATK